MPYSDQLSPWVVYRLLPNCQRLLLARFRKRNNAEDYIRVLRQMQPQIDLTITFEVESPASLPASIATESPTSQPPTSQQPDRSAT